MNQISMLFRYTSLMDFRSADYPLHILTEELTNMAAVHKTDHAL